MLLILLHEERVVHVLIVGHIEQQHIKQLAIETRVSLGLLENLAKLKQ
jgi:UDP-2,3-diacylglucosamine pyrophosphatase LpxH